MQGVLGVICYIDVTGASEENHLRNLEEVLRRLEEHGFRLIRNLASILYPLNRLLQEKQKWEWTNECSEAFKRAKNQLTSSEKLTHYDPKLPTNLAADASAYGIGAVISHELPDGSEKPISFASRTLTTSEK